MATKNRSHILYLQVVNTRSIVACVDNISSCMLLLTACPGNCLLYFPTAEDYPDLWACCGDQLSGGLCSSGHYIL